MTTRVYSGYRTGSKKQLIEKMYRLIEEHGPLTSVDIEGLILDSITSFGRSPRMLCPTLNVISQTLSKSPLFAKTKRVERGGKVVSKKKTTMVWEYKVVPVIEVAEKIASYKHRVQSKKRMPNFLWKEIERIKSERESEGDE